MIAEQARDEGIARVEYNNKSWMQDGLYRIEKLTNWRGIAEDLRYHLLASGLRSPLHPNAWGALTRQALKRGLLKRTGNWRSPQDVASHARPTQEYVR